MNESTPDNTVPCRFCQRQIHAKAIKCPYCREFLTKRSRFSRATTKTVTLAGLTTALMSLFYGLNEGYFYIEERQQQRDAFASYMGAAEQFLKLDNLEYAEASLEQALAINPNDSRLRLRHFLLRAQHLLREVDYYGYQLPAAQLAVMPTLVTDGFSLLETKFMSHDQAQLLLSLARLLQYDRRWQSPSAIEALFVQAQQQKADDANIVYWYGDWLWHQAESQDKVEQGYRLIQQAARLKPDNALYVAGLGRLQAKRGDYQQAFASFSQAIKLRPSQHTLQNVRAANEAKGALARTLHAADQIQDISGTQFFGLDMPERLKLTEFALENAASDRNLRMLAARLFHHLGHDQKAEPILEKLLGRYDERSNTDSLNLYVAVLKANNNLAEAQRVEQTLARQQELASYEEILETNIDGQHRYKVGLRVSKKNSDEGVRVLKVYQAYPFEKAGLKEGDHILEFAHRKVTSLRSIWVPINEFTPGTDVPLLIRRGDEILNLTLVIE